MQTGRTSRRPTSTARLKSQRVVYIKRDILWRPPVEPRSTFARWLASPHMRLHGPEALRALVTACCGSVETYSTVIRPALDDAIAAARVADDRPAGGGNGAGDDGAAAAVREVFASYLRRRFPLAETSVRCAGSQVTLQARCASRAMWTSTLTVHGSGEGVMIDEGHIEVVANAAGLDCTYDLEARRKVPAGATLADLERIEDELQLELSSFLMAWTLAEEQPYARILAPDALPNLPAVLAHQTLSSSFS